MASLQQRTPEWHAARRNKLTCSNLGALLGQVSYTTRAQAYSRAIGTDTFTGNVATQWGVDNEGNGLTRYMEKTGNVVVATGLHTHPKYKWLAGSPDGLVGEEGMVEVKCPYYSKKGRSRLHDTVPGHYFMQVNALLEITGRAWCDYICWAPEGMVVYRVYRDSAVFDYLSQYYFAINAAIMAGASDPPPLSGASRLEIAEQVEAAISRSVDTKFWVAVVNTQPPSRDEDTVPPAKRRDLSASGRSKRVYGDQKQTSAGNAVRGEDTPPEQEPPASPVPEVRDAEV